MTTRTPKALQAWTGLNDRQQGTLAVIFELDQEAEAARRRDAANGYYSKEPASSWRAIDFAHDPSLRDLVGWTTMQLRLESRGWDNQGNGSTIAALASRGLLTRSTRPTALGFMHRVRLTTEGRAAARAALAMPATGRAALSERAWEVLALLWKAGQQGGKLAWGPSPTIEKTLIGKHVPPLAEHVPGGYRITERGQWFYREHYAAHTAAHPEIRAPHPDGADAEPWPAAADQILNAHRSLYYALRGQWEDACAAAVAAETEAGAAPPVLPGNLPGPVAEQVMTRHKTWITTARQRADLAGSQADDIGRRTARAARAYAVAALAVFAAAAAGSDPLRDLLPPGDTDDWDEQRLAPPAETGIHVLDAEARKLHADAAGTPLKRRGPAPSRKRNRYMPPPAPEAPGRKLTALADHLRRHTDGGVLSRRMKGPRT